MGTPRSLRSKLFVATSLVITSVVLVAMVGLTGMLERASRKRIADDLLTARASFERFETLRAELLARNASSVAANPYSKAALDIEGLDHLTALDAAANARTMADADFAMLTDGRDVVLADTLHPDIHGSRVSIRPGLRRIDGVPYRVAVAPVVTGEQLLGQLVLGRRLDRLWTADVHRVTGLDVTLLNAGRVLAHTWTIPVPLDGALPLAGLDSLRAGSHRPQQEVTIGDRDCHAIALALAPGVELVLSRSADRLRALNRDVRIFVLLGGVLAASLGLLLCGWTARKVARPISDLVKASSDLATGDLGVTVPRSDTIEFDRLATAFNRMARRIESLIAEVRDKAVVLERQTADLQAANVSKDQFLTTAGHELRTPVTNILSYSEMLAQFAADEDPRTQREFTEIIQVESERLGQLVDKILVMAELDAGVASWRIDDLSLGRLLDELVERRTWCRGAPSDRPVHLSLPDEEVRYAGDARRLAMAVGNVLCNADKFSPAGAAIELRLRCDDEGATIEVQDHGPGVPEAERERVFERFHQAGDPLTDKPEGFGLGLSISREIVRMHGGDIECRGGAAGGATFSLRLPWPGCPDHRPVALTARSTVGAARTAPSG